MSYQGLVKVNDAMGLGLSVAYDTGMDYKKVNTTMLLEKSAYHIGGKLMQPMLNNFLPKFLKDKEDFLYTKSNQEHLTTGLIAGVYTYYGKNKTFKDAMMNAAIEGGSSYLGDQIRRSLSQNPDIKLKDDILL